jgi:uncharacterized protein involved in tolerance to divalent cations
MPEQAISPHSVISFFYVHKQQVCVKLLLAPSVKACLQHVNVIHSATAWSEALLAIMQLLVVFKVCHDA